MGDNVGSVKVGAIFEAVVFEAEDVEAGFVPGDEFIVVVGVPSAIQVFVGPGRFEGVAVRRVVEFDKLDERIRLGMKC